MKELIERVWETSVQNPEGFTLSLETFELIQGGYAVAYEETQDSYGRESLEVVIKHALEHDKVVGGWLFDGRYYFDSVRVFPPQQIVEAIRFATANEQIGYFDLVRQITVLINE